MYISQYIQASYAICAVGLVHKHSNDYFQLKFLIYLHQSKIYGLNPIVPLYSQIQEDSFANEMGRLMIFLQFLLPTEAICKNGLPSPISRDVC